MKMYHKKLIKVKEGACVNFFLRLMNIEQYSWIKKNGAWSRLQLPIVSRMGFTGQISKMYVKNKSYKFINQTKF